VRKIVVAGSEGVIGRALVAGMRGMKDVEVVPLDLSLGHDLTNEAQVRSLFQTHRDAQYLVNLFAINDHVEAGRAKPDLFEVSLDSLRKYCEINLVALFSVCREFARHCARPAAIVNFSSLYGVRSPKHFLYDGPSKDIGYTLTKHGVIGLTRHLATFLAPGIRVNCLVPGGVEHQQDDAFKTKFNRHVPMGRMLQATELTGIVDLLCSEQSSYITGAVIPVDGGWTAW
jgi:NAD(P)-dependent dehydrogenase (short-subunit alcohol dehydrogenase family)